MPRDLDEKTMPITFAIYGKHGKQRRPKKEKEYEPRRHATPVWHSTRQEDLDALGSQYGARIRRLAARKRVESL